MTSKKHKLMDAASDPFSDDNNAANNTGFQSLDSALYGAINKADSLYMKASPVNIFHIHPDLKQPRRAIPSKVREEVNWDGSPQMITTGVFDVGIAHSRKNRG